MAMGFSDLVTALQASIAQARIAMERQHYDQLRRWFDTSTDNKMWKPKTQKIELPRVSADEGDGVDQSFTEVVDVPLLGLVPVSTIQIDQIDIEFETLLNPQEKENKSGGIDLLIGRSALGGSTKANVKIRFSTTDAPESISRMVDRSSQTII